MPQQAGHYSLELGYATTNTLPECWHHFKEGQCPPEGDNNCPCNHPLSHMHALLCYRACFPMLTSRSSPSSAQHPNSRWSSQHSTARSGSSRWPSIHTGHQPRQHSSTHRRVATTASTGAQTQAAAASWCQPAPQASCHRHSSSSQQATSCHCLDSGRRGPQRHTAGSSRWRDECGGQAAAPPAPQQQEACSSRHG